MNTFLRKLAALPLVLAAVSAHADDFTVTGDIVFHNDVIQIPFSLAADGADVRIWTDSWMSGLNFDPIIAVWERGAGPADFTLIAEVDDDDSVGPGQGFYDAGITFATLAGGDYLVTLVTAINAANGTQLSQGFAYDGESPIPIGMWNQPTYDPNANDQKGSFYRLHFVGVDQVTAIPEPEALLLMAAGLIVLVVRRRAPR